MSRNPPSLLRTLPQSLPDAQESKPLCSHFGSYPSVFRDCANIQVWETLEVSQSFHCSKIVATYDLLCAEKALSSALERSDFMKRRSCRPVSLVHSNMALLLTSCCCVSVTFPPGRLSVLTLCPLWAYLALCDIGGTQAGQL